MPTSIVPPDLRNILGDLARRLGILERRVTPRGEGAGVGHTHDGAGGSATIVTGLSAEDAATATGVYATAVGDYAQANQEKSTAVGFGTQANSIGSGLDRGGVAIGDSARSEGNEAVAVGANSRAEADAAVVIGGGSSGFQQTVVLGNGASATADNQIQLGTRFDRTLQGVPNSAIPDADLEIGQMSFYLNEGSDLLTVKVRYSGGAVKTGTVALT